MLPTIRTILYATDLGPHGPRVFRYAVALAREHGAKIVLLHVIEPIGETAETLVRNLVPEGTFEAAHREGLERIRAEIRERLEHFCQTEFGSSSADEKPVAEIHIAEGWPAPTIIAEAASMGADLIVMGAHTHPVVEEMILGSVANKVVQKSAIPVFLVPIRSA